MKVWMAMAVPLILLVVAAPALAAPLKTCSDTGLDDLRAKNIRCDTAKRVYRRSQRECGPENLDGVYCDPFKYLGLRWRCRAYNPHHRNGNPAWYEWKCRASGNRVVHYRWKAGD